MSHYALDSTSEVEGPANHRGIHKVHQETIFSPSD